MKSKKIKEILKFIIALTIVLSFFYFYVGGELFGGINNYKIEPVSTEMSAEIVQAYHIVLPKDVHIVNVIGYYWCIDGYTVIKLQGLTDIDELLNLNKSNYIEEYATQVNAIDNVSRIDNFAFYPNLKYMPATSNGISVLYDDDYVYLSIADCHVYGKQVNDVFAKYYK